MTIGMQGTWSVAVASKDAAWAQRFVIAGSSNGVDGDYAGETSTAPVLVEGPQWGVTIEHDPTGPASWTASRMRLGNFRVEGTTFKVDLQSDDGGSTDEDFNDLVLTASMALSESEWVVYGTAKTYAGLCLFNPCFGPPWVVIDTVDQLRRLRRFPQMASILDKTYGDVAAARAAGDLEMRPMVLGLGGRTHEGIAVAGVTSLEKAPRRKEVTVTGEAVLRLAASPEYPTLLDRVDRIVLDRLGLRFACDVDPLGQALMRFTEYDRTADEKSGGSYTGTGNREVLGHTSSDEFGNYLFRFGRTLAQLVGEVIGDVTGTEDPAVGVRPDLIIGFVDSPAAIAAVHETAPYYDIANVRRIDLCIPAGKLVPKPCKGDRVIQYLGDIPIITNPHSALHADGTVSNDGAEGGPTVQHAAWQGTVDVIGCFESAVSPVTRYTVEASTDGTGFGFLSLPASGLRQQSDGTWDLESYGPDDTGLHINGAALPAVTVPAYRNIEDEAGWSLGVEHRKVRIAVQNHISPGPSGRRIGHLWLRIRGFDASGNPVPLAADTIKLFVDDQPAVGDIASVTLPGGPDPGGCALIELPTNTTPLHVRLRATDADGFLDAWSLSVIRGSNEDLGQLADDTYTNTSPFRFHGTTEDATADIEGYVVLPVTPAGGWLPPGEEFCGFSFELYVRDRTTNGVTAPGSRRVWDEVIGLQAAPTP
jgi:hypothetical protein